MIAADPAARAIALTAMVAAAICVPLLVLWALRLRILGRHEGKAGSDRISLAALRALRDRGQLTEDEFARAREVVLREHGVARARPDRADRSGDTPEREAGPAPESASDDALRNS